MRTVQLPRRLTRKAWGGTETVVLESSRQLLSLGHPTEIFTTTALDERRQEELNGVKVRRFPYFYPYVGLQTRHRESLDRCGGNLFSWALGGRLMTTPGLQLLHLHTGKRLGGIARTAARLRGLPYVVSLHGGLYTAPAGEQQRLRQPTSKSFEYGKALGWMVGSRRVLDDAGAILCLSRAEQEAVLSRHPGKRVLVLPNGVDPARFHWADADAFRRRHGLDPAARVVGVIGRIDPQKNQLFALSCLAQLEDAHLLMVGPVTDESYHRRLQNTVEKQGLQKRVTLLPGLSGRELVEAYHSCQVLFTPSTHEPFGIVVLESWASGRPVVAARVGGTAELIQSHQDGILYDGGDRSAAVAALRQLLDRPQQARQMGANGRDRVRRQFSWRIHALRLLEIYQEVLDEHRFCQ